MQEPPQLNNAVIHAFTDEFNYNLKEEFRISNVMLDSEDGEFCKSTCSGNTAHIDFK